jgi:purine-binding chemotaxis protein CheW
MEESSTVNTKQYVTFCLAEELFGVEVSRAREILSVVSVTSVPQTPDAAQLPSRV